MDFPKWFKISLLAVNGAGWMVAYFLIIYRSYKDKTYGMPFIALAFNISWEFFYSFVFNSPELNLQTIINRFWFAADVVILFFYFAYGKKDWKYSQTIRLFYPYSLFILFAAAGLLYFFEMDFLNDAVTYSAFIMNVIISASFLQMILHRNSLAGQSFGIALFKLIGTLSATIFLLDGFTSFLILLGLICFILDVVYLFLVLRIYKQQQLHFITRKQYHYV